MTQPRQPKELSPKIVDMLNNRLKDEYAAHFFYRNAANWCDDANYKKAAAFFTQEACKLERNTNPTSRKTDHNLC